MFSNFSIGDLEDLMLGKPFTTQIVKISERVLSWSLVKCDSLEKIEKGDKNDLETSLEAVKTLFGVTLHYVYAECGGIITTDEVVASIVLCSLLSKKEKGIKYSESLERHFDLIEDLVN